MTDFSDIINDPAGSMERGLQQIENVQRGVGDRFGDTVSTDEELGAGSSMKSLFLRSFQKKEDRDAYFEVINLNGNAVSDDREYRFIISDAQMPQKERFQILPTFGNNSDFLSTFGKDTDMWSFSGHLRNERRLRQNALQGDGDWVNAMRSRYKSQYRASVLARNRQMLRLVMGDLTIEGYMLNFSINKASSSMDDVYARFQFQMMVRNYYTITNPLLEEVESSELDAGEDI